MNPNSQKDDEERNAECCICINAMAPFQALFLAPCSHCFHYKCVTTLLGAGFMFQCPLCRQVANLEASVAEPDDLSEQEDDHEDIMEVEEAPNSRTLMRKAKNVVIMEREETPVGSSGSIEIPNQNPVAQTMESTPRDYTVLGSVITEDATHTPSTPGVINTQILDALTKITNAVSIGDSSNIDVYLREYSANLKNALAASVSDSNSPMFKDILNRLFPSDDSEIQSHHTN
jgi:hypothetical protein